MVMVVSMDQRSKYGILTTIASFGQSVSQARQYQHSSKRMCAFFVTGSIERQSTGQESMHTRQPLMHFS
jgi:hypothetical protein